MRAAPSKPEGSDKLLAFEVANALYALPIEVVPSPDAAMKRSAVAATMSGKSTVPMRACQTRLPAICV